MSEDAAWRDRPKVIFFDAMGTLFGIRGSVGSVYAEVARKFGIEVSAAALNQAFGASFKQAPPMAFPGAPAADLKRLEYHWWAAIARQSFAQANALEKFKDFDRFFDYLYDYFATAEPWELYDDTRPTLNYWRDQGVALGVISNFDSRLYDVLEALQLDGYFSSVTISTEVGAAKPSAAVFQRAIAQHNCLPQEAWHVGDSIGEDYEGAIAAGLQGIWLDRPAP